MGYEDDHWSFGRSGDRWDRATTCISEEAMNTGREGLGFGLGWIWPAFSSEKCHPSMME